LFTDKDKDNALQLTDKNQGTKSRQKLKTKL